MIVAQRLQEAMDLRNVDQSALAAAVGVTAGTISLIVLGKTRRSKHLPEIAAFLRVRYEWLIGRSDEMSPDSSKAGSEASPQPIHHVMMAVAMPDQRALARMFEGLLLAMPAGADLAEQADLLAERLPIGLAQLRDLLPIAPAAPARAPRALVEAGATPGPGSR